jgi:hypothetical protein
MNSPKLQFDDSVEDVPVSGRAVVLTDEMWRALRFAAEWMCARAHEVPEGDEDVTKGPSTFNWLIHAANLMQLEASVRGPGMFPIEAREAQDDLPVRGKKEEQDIQSRVAPLNDCVETTGSTAEKSPGEVITAERTKKRAKRRLCMPCEKWWPAKHRECPECGADTEREL